ncbi:MAG: hypothetical protein IJZ60_02560 [Bacteroides sp.]|nr:hypothetical protein [Bacteroides sp.]
MKLLYTLDDITDLESALSIANEIKAEVGIVPDYIELDSGIKIPYSQVRKEEMESIQVK